MEESRHQDSQAFAQSGFERQPADANLRITGLNSKKKAMRFGFLLLRSITCSNKLRGRYRVLEGSQTGRIAIGELVNGL